MGPSVKWKYIKTFLFQNVNARQTVVKNALWLGTSNVLGRIIRAGLIIYAARLLGTEGYGVFSYALGLAAFFSVFSDIGVSGILTREAVRHPESVNQLVGTSVFVKIFLLVISILIIMIGAPFITKIPESLALLPLAALLLTFDGFRDFTLSIARAKERMEIEGLTNIVTNLAITGIGTAVLFARPTPFFLMAGYTAGSGVGMLVALVALREHFRSPAKNFRVNLLKPLLVEAFPFALMGILGTLMLNTDTVMLGWLSDAKTVGLYSAAQRPIQILYVIPTFLASALFPAFARLAVDTGDKFRSVLERALSISMFLALPIMFGGLALGKSIVLLLFGQEYAGAAIPFMILLGTIITSYSAGFVSNAVFAHGEQKNFIGSLLLGALGNLGLNFLLIPRYGIIGSCIATIGAQLLSQGFLWFKLKQIRPFRLFPHLKKIIPASLGMAAIVLMLSKTGVPVLWNILIGAVIYFGALYLWKEKLLEDLRLPKLEA